MHVCVRCLLMLTYCVTSVLGAVLLLLLRPGCADCRDAQSERILRSQVLHLQQQVNELNAKQVDLLGQKQQLQVSV